jgi:uncharacterized protein YfaS (alpha-2-macroglobulin family)
VVRAPIVAEASMPRVLAPGDRSTVTLDITNFTGKPGEFKVRVDGIGPHVVGEAARSAAACRRSQDHVEFPAAAQEGYTVAQVRVRVDGNGASRSIASTTCRCDRRGRRCCVRAPKCWAKPAAGRRWMPASPKA